MKFREDEAVSPVIGVILMVAVTVVLAVAVFMIAQQYGQTQMGSQSVIMVSPRDAPGQMSDRTEDPIAVLRLTSLSGDPYDLGSVAFSVSSDGVSWSPVAHSPGRGPWMAGMTVTLTELSADQVSTGPCYVSMTAFTESGSSEVYRSNVFYIN